MTSSDIYIAHVRERLKDPGRFRMKGFDRINSTNDYLYRLGKDEQPEWTVVTAEEQTAGRGRYQRRWDSPPGKGLWFSILLRPSVDLHNVNLINLFTAYTLAEFLEARFRSLSANPPEVRLKWPNDLWIKGRKLCGILLEANLTASRLLYIVVGIGLNVNQDAMDFPEEVRENAISLKLATGHHWERAALLAEFLDHFYENYHAHLTEQFQTVIAYYLGKVLFLGETITVSTGSAKKNGIFSGLTPEGYLVLSREDREEIITTGDVFQIRATREKA